MLRSRRLVFWLTCLGVFMAAATATRLGLAGWVAALDHRTVGELPLALAFGIINDAAMAIVLGLPFLLGLFLLHRLWRWRPATWLAHLMLAALLGVLIFAAMAEFFYWNEFNGRFAGIAVNYLIFPREVIGNIRESFDTRLTLPPIVAAAGLLYLILRRRLGHALAEPVAPGSRGRSLGLAALALCIAIPFLYFGPLQASHNREINEVARNGLYSLFHAFLTNDAHYDGIYPGIAEADALPLMRATVAQDNVRFLDPSDRRSLRRAVDNGAAPKKLHIVLVINESFGSIFVDSLDNPLPERISPELEGLARDGLFFTNIYSTGDRTVRGLESLLTSFTPIPGISTSRRAGSEGMSSWPFLLKKHGYRSAFLYGGRALFDNMGYYWSTIGFDAVWEQKDIAEPGFTTAWGVADEYLYADALKRLDQQARADQPFFLAMLTVSNHRPYTYPTGRIDKDPTRKRRENAATYADWAFGDFIKQARNRPWFDDTVFIFVGDHGPKVNGAAQVPIEGFRVPLLFYSPKHVAPARLDTVGSTMDMGPTLMGLLGLSFDSPFFGIDLRRVPPGQGRFAMAHNFSVAWGTRGLVAVLEPNGAVKGYRVAGQGLALERLEQPDADVARIATAVTQTAHRMFYGREYHEAGK
ncbi:MAG: LTA synthase family protein [Alphaproteobacteria bacterium]|nr:LTA synthase family protein [Alphaproteobacteria bacterium]